MAKAIAIEFLQIYSSPLSETIGKIMASSKFRPAILPIGEGEQPIRELHPQEMALFTALLNITDKHNAISSTPPLSLLEKILLGEYAEQYELCNDLLMEAIMLHPETMDLSRDRIGIREGHIVVLLPEKKIDFEFVMFQQDCLQCPSYLACDHPEKMTL